MSRVKVALTASLAVSTFVVVLFGVTALLTSGALDAKRSMWNDLAERRVQTEELKALIDERRAEIFADPASPVGGNPQGDITLAQFFDYNCAYCRAAAPLVRQAQEADTGLKLVYKEFPILGPGSDFAARAALASRSQGRYAAFHQALMAHSGAVDERSTLEIAEDVGLDIGQLTLGMADPAISAAIERNLALANDLRVIGTPTFIVGDEIVPGLLDLPTLQSFIAAAREAADE